MKKFIFKTLLLTLPIVVFALSMEYLLRQIPNDYAYKKDYLNKHAEEIEVLILGASHTLYGVNPSILQYNAFNASHVSQSWDLDFEIFDSYLDRFKNLKIIILSTSARSFWYSLEKGEEPWRVSKYVIYYGKKSNSLRENSEFLSNKFFINMERLYKYYLKGINEIRSDSLGYVNNNGNLTGNLKAVVGRHSINNISSTTNTKMFGENLEILHSFLKICSERNIKVILLSSPTFYTYRKNLNIEQVKKTKETINELVKMYDNAIYLDWQEDSDFLAEDFYNADHLNECGAKKLSIKLKNAIISLTH